MDVGAGWNADRQGSMDPRAATPKGVQKKAESALNGTAAVSRERKRGKDRLKENSSEFDKSNGKDRKRHPGNYTVFCQMLCIKRKISSLEFLCLPFQPWHHF